MNENQLTLVKEYEFDKPLIRKIESIIDNCIRDCHNKYFHTFEYKSVYDISKNGIVKLTLADRIMN